MLVAFLGLMGHAAADEAVWIRVRAGGKAFLFRPDGTGRTEVAVVADPVGRQVSPDPLHALVTLRKCSTLYNFPTNSPSNTARAPAGGTYSVNPP